MHTILVITGGVILLGVFLAGARLKGENSGHALANAALLFIPVWFIAAAINLWIGISRAGYTFAQEFPIFILVFGAPTLAAVLLWWLCRRN